MNSRDLQIIYPKANEDNGKFHEYFAEEVAALLKAGLDVRTTPDRCAQRLLLRSFVISEEKDFPNDKRYIQQWPQMKATRNMAISSIAVRFDDTLFHNTIIR